MADDEKFIMVPRWAFRDIPMNPRARAVWIALISYADNETGYCYPSRETLAKDTQLGVATVSRAIQDLIGLGVIAVAKRGAGGMQSSNGYTVLVRHGARAATPDQIDTAENPPIAMPDQIDTAEKSTLDQIDTAMWRDRTAPAIGIIQSDPAHVSNRAVTTDQIDTRTRPTELHPLNETHTRERVDAKKTTSHRDDDGSPITEGGWQTIDLDAPRAPIPFVPRASRAPGLTNAEIDTLFSEETS